MDKSSGLFSDRLPWLWILIAAGAFFYIPFIGGVHLFDWDEINFAEISREMVMTGDYLRVQVDYKPFFEKPPFFFWLQSLSMHTFGINEFAARLPNAFAGILVLVFIYQLGTHWISKRFGILWALSYLGSLLPTFYHKSGIIDPWFNLFIFASIAAWIEGSKERSSNRWHLISGALSGLAVLTKGPVGPLIVGITILLAALSLQNKNFLRIRSIILFLLACAFVAVLWFGVEWLAHGPAFITSFLKYQLELLSQSVAGHKGFPGYHFVVAILGIFPASIFALAAFRKKRPDENVDDWTLRLLMILLTIIVLVLFTIVKSKIVHYSSLAYYPVTFLSAWTLLYLLDGKIRLPKWQALFSIIVAFIIGGSLFALPYAGLNIEWLKSAFRFDDFTEAILNADVRWDYFDFVPFFFFLAVIVTSLVLYRSNRTAHSFIVLFGGMAFVVNLFLVFFIGKIEHYAQRAAIEFYQSKAGQDVEIKTEGFHSYAPFFYAKKPIPAYTDSEKKQFYVVRADKRNLLKDRPELKVLYEKNGFIFLEK